MAQNRFMKLLGSNEEEEMPQIPYKPKEEQTKQPEYPKFELDASKPYAGIVEQVWGKPTLDEKAIKRNNGIIKTQGLTDMLRLVAEGVTGSMGGDIIRRGENKVAAKAVQDNEKLYDIFRNEQARYNAMRMQEMLKNMDYGIRQKERVEDRKWQNDTWKERFGMQNEVADERTKQSQEFQSGENEKNRAHQEKMTDKRIGGQNWLAQQNFDRSIDLLQRKPELEVGTSSKPYVQILGDDGVPVNLSQGQYNYILSQMIENPKMKETIDGLSVAGDSYSKNRLNVLVQQYANKFFDVKNGQIYPKGTKKYNTGDAY